MARWFSQIVVFLVLTGCASAPDAPSVPGSAEPEPGLFLGQYAFAERTQTAKGEHLVIGVFYFLDAELVPYEQLTFPVIAARRGARYFSVGVVLPKESLEGATKLEQEYGAIAPYMLVKGHPERVLQIRGLSVVRMQVEDAWNLDAGQVRVAANNAIESVGHPTRKCDALLLAAHR